MYLLGSNLVSTLGNYCYFSGSFGVTSKFLTCFGFWVFKFKESCFFWLNFKFWHLGFLRWASSCLNWVNFTVHLGNLDTAFDLILGEADFL